MHLKKSDFINQQIEEYYFNKDKQAWDMIMRVYAQIHYSNHNSFNKKRKDFEDEEEFYLYQEKIEDYSTCTILICSL